MQPENEPTERPEGRLTRVRVLYRNVSKRRLGWLLLKDVVHSCMTYRVTGLAAEAAFFCLLSLPPLLLGLIGLLGYLEPWIGRATIDGVREQILHASSAVLSYQGVNEIARPLLDDVFTGRRPDVISLGFALALWSGSRALNVFVDTITIMYGLDGRRGIVRTRLLAFVLYLGALVVGAVALPLMVVGPDTLVHWLPASADVIRALYWPVVLLLSVAFLTTLYHVSVPVRSPWQEDIPGAVVALAMWVLGSFLLRIYLTATVEGPTIYGSLAAPVAVLLWIGVSAFAVLVGAATNAATDRVWPSVATAAARAEKERRAAQVAAEHEEAPEECGDETEDNGADDDEDDDEDDADEPLPPAEYPERWARFLPPEEIRGRLPRRRRHRRPRRR
ncbi:YihY/virulence factor BrkB family protein [Streptomyces benahoarensis]|uniref:YihY/virulence factor BrkB family protein n=1 Tax=Streptomyces benahoarensis TaxID=2595054 RepID=A0A553YB03_9ACTN|nr:YihY/virulence factor BrkB family protein [Streptomyces benahoarensis]TSB16404.1 YihY/virulence factor BrkB family protein [Streptomyces benahoarensis]TSB26370.1 YihY/virulence factor BrkB family protein [Streptomyces benahoarensis]